LLHDTTGLFNIGTILPRLEIIYSFFSSFNATNVFGVGLGCMEGVVDNMYIRILIETGIIGFFIFMVFIYTAIKQLYYIDKKSTQFHSRTNFFLFLLLIVITFSMHSGELLMSRFSIIVFIYVVTCINAEYKKIIECEFMLSKN
jgi:hypothetical protein